MLGKGDGVLFVMGQNQKFGVPFVFIVKDPLHLLPSILGRKCTNVQWLGFGDHVELEFPRIR